MNYAHKEKALLDILYFRSNAYYASLVWEKLNYYRRMIDLDLLKKYAKKFNLDVIRQIGFFMDRLGIDTTDLREKVKNKTSYSRMTKESKKFDPRWRLYFDDSFIK